MWIIPNVEAASNPWITDHDHDLIVWRTYAQKIQYKLSYFAGRDWFSGKLMDGHAGRGISEGSSEFNVHIIVCTLWYKTWTWSTLPRSPSYKLPSWSWLSTFGLCLSPRAQFTFLDRDPGWILIMTFSMSKFIGRDANDGKTVMMTLEWHDVMCFPTWHPRDWAWAATTSRSNAFVAWLPQSRFLSLKKSRASYEYLATNRVMRGLTRCGASSWGQCPTPGSTTNSSTVAISPYARPNFTGSQGSSSPHPISTGHCAQWVWGKWW